MGRSLGSVMVVFSCVSVEVLDCIEFWVLPSALLLYLKNIKQIFLSETTMYNTLIFGMQHHLYASTNFIQFGTEGLLSGPACELTRSL